MVKSYSRLFFRLIPPLTLIILVAVFTLHISAQPSSAPQKVAAPLFAQPQSPFVKVYEKVAPAVVKIDVKTEVTRQIDPFFQQFFKIPQNQKRLQQGMGSGVIIDREGHILTNNHVVADAKEIKVILSDNEKFDATVVGTDPDTDVAVIQLKMKEKSLPANYVADLGDSDQLKPGDWAIAIGNPLGLDRTITVGVISALGRTGLQAQGGPKFQYFIQTDAQINPGNSGGALADINGKVIGINNMYNPDYAGIGFAIPINMAKSVMNKILTTGKVAKGFLGIHGKDIDQDTKAALDLSGTEGVLVDLVVSNAPSEKAGIKIGDVIVSLDGKTVKNYDDFLNRIASQNPGDTVKLEIIDSGVKKTVPVKLADRSDYANATPGPATDESVWRGIHAAGLNSQQFNFPESVKSGVVVTQIDDNSPAADSQIQAGDVITEIWIGKARKAIKTVQDFDNFKNEYKNNKRPMLIYRLRVLDNGQVIRGLVSIKGEE
ncbi:MAG: trypsin-like peptidase domain-containing protein [Candidatus Latescibacter sp.]|nr:trypsin-like peptidase domain-containing protein [Candidatus Latescibacter sp.]